MISLFNAEKGDVTLWLNMHNTPLLDLFFKWVTYVGTLWLCVPVVLWFLYKEKVKGYLLIAGYAIAGIIIHLIKRVLVEPNFRPFWGLKGKFHQVEGVEIKKLYSFPSGHTGTAFLMFLFLSLMSKNKIWGGLFLVSAMLVAISRMYLYQHFFQDTVMGSFIGVVVMTTLYYVFKKKEWIV